MNREQALARLRRTVAAGKAIIGTGSGIGLAAVCADRAGVDLIGVATSSYFRMAGRGALAGVLSYANANDIILRLADEILPVVRNTPVLANLCGTDPLRPIPRLLREIKSLGFVGVQNFPTVGIIDGNFRLALEETGMGYGLEVDMVRLAHEMELLTCPYVFDEEQAVDMTKAGADIIVPHMGITTKGHGGGSTAISLDEAVRRAAAMLEAAKRVNPDVLVLCHGGPIATPEDVRYVVGHVSGLHGFFGGASNDVLATEPAMMAFANDLKAISLTSQTQR